MRRSSRWYRWTGRRTNAREKNVNWRTKTLKAYRGGQGREAQVNGHGAEDRDCLLQIAARV